MSDLVQAGFGMHNNNHPTPQQTLLHLRSLSSNTAKRKPSISPRLISKSVSTGALHAATRTSKPLPIPIKRVPSEYSDADGNMSTLPDPRSRTMSPAGDSGPPSPAAHPDLSNEVETLSNKLISAINHQTNLDDNLSATRQELELARERMKKLEQENSDHAELMARGILIRKSVADIEKNRLATQLGDERKLREAVEQEKKAIELELENLTTALFEEANKMVITARESAQKDHDMVQKRNDQLKVQLADTETLLKSHQEQLAELKVVMEHLTEAREDATDHTAPSTPGLSKFDSKEDVSHDGEGNRTSSLPDPVSPSYPTSFTHLLRPVLRTDLSAYEDFTSILRISKNIAGSRVSSGSYGTIGLGLGLGGYSAAGPSTGSTSSITTSIGSSPATPTTPASSVSINSSNGSNSLTLLKDTKFYKRSLAEDIEPTLRLDAAPGLSWLARRTVLNAVCEGNLVIEPMPVSTKPYLYACSLCGEARRDPSHIRSHRFRTSDNENAQRYPLCRYCHGRVRSTCDFLGFLRIVRDGHWRAEDEQAEKGAWEESVRLREQMFWCRMGGGVVPTQQTQADLLRSPRPSGDSRSLQEKELTREIEETGEIRPRDVTPMTEILPESSSTLNSTRGSKSMMSPIIVHDDVASSMSAPNVSNAIPLEDVQTVHQITKDKSRESVRSTTSVNLVSKNESPESLQRLSITIPGTQD